MESEKVSVKIDAISIVLHYQLCLLFPFATQVMTIGPISEASSQKGRFYKRMKKKIGVVNNANLFFQPMI